MKSRKRATKTTRSRFYRTTKKHPRRPRAILKMDLGKVEQQISVVFPEDSTYRNVEIPKERNPELITWRMADLKFAYYFKDRKGFIYDCDGIYLGSFDKTDLKKHFAKCGSVLWFVRRQKA